MNYAEFIDSVKKQAGIASGTEAQKASCATLNVLAERLQEQEARHLADQLPAELAGCLTQTPGHEQFGIDEFYRRVSRREGVDEKVASDHANAVVEILKEAVSVNELKEIISELPYEYDDLFKIPRVERIR